MAERGPTLEITDERSVGILLDGRDMPSHLTEGSQTFTRNAFGYWMSASQDGGARVQWISFTPDLAMAPIGHVYTELQTEARWLL